MNRRSFIPAIVLSCSLLAFAGASGAVEVGEKAPDIDLQSTKGGNFKLSDLAGKKHLVIQFYVLDFTPT